MNVVKYWKLGEIAERLRVDHSTVRNWVKSGKLKGMKFGGEYRVEDKDLKDFFESSRIVIEEEIK